MWQLDISFFKALNELSNQIPWIGAVGIFLAQDLIFIMVGLIVLFPIHAVFIDSSFERNRIVIKSVAILWRSAAAILGAILDGLLISLFFFRARPFASLPEASLLINPPLTAKSFPSDHAAIAFALAVSVLLIRRRWGLLLLFAACAVAVGRILVGVHYPLDVLVGAILGAAWALVVAFIGRCWKDMARIKRYLFPNDKV
jgi:undecaprenyl-diphosphatase